MIVVGELFILPFGFCPGLGIRLILEVLAVLPPLGRPVRSHPLPARKNLIDFSDHLVLLRSGSKTADSNGE
jgi:hypothetical protein